jgi:hypothetical protein
MSTYESELMLRVAHGLGRQWDSQITDSLQTAYDPTKEKLSVSPTPRQTDFLNLKCDEALYGGAAGGGKSVALLMWLAEGVHIPGYSGIIFRRTYKQLTKSNDSLVGISMRLYPALGGRWNGTDKQWRFPSGPNADNPYIGGAIIEMGALEHEMSVLDYQGPAYHRVAWDELTQFTESQYDYIVSSRIRRVRGFPISMGSRAGSNPGGPGHDWVLGRFITEEAMAFIDTLKPREPSPTGMVFYTPEGRAFVPARLADNPHMDDEDYARRLAGFKNPVTRERLANGDWRIREDSVINPLWLRSFDTRGDYLLPLATDRKPAGDQVSEVDLAPWRFATIDTAGTSKQKALESKGKPHSWSVCAIYDYWPLKDLLFLRHVWRQRVAWEDLKAGVIATLKAWDCRRADIENAHFGGPLAQEIQNALPGTSTSLVGPVIGGMTGQSGDGAKLERATASGLLTRLEAGKFFLPVDDPAWKAEFEGELLRWTGLPDETADQIDVASYGCYHVGGLGSGAVTVIEMPQSGRPNLWGMRR